jgi:hypothetical protein
VLVVLGFLLLTCGYKYYDETSPNVHIIRRSSGKRLHFLVAYKGLQLYIHSCFVLLTMGVFFWVIASYYYPSLLENLSSYLQDAGYTRNSIIDHIIFISCVWYYFLTSIRIRYQNWQFNNQYNSLAKQLQAIQQHITDNFESSIIDYITFDTSVLITMKSGKTYVGKIVEDLNIIEKIEHLLLIPTISGYRDSHTFTVHFHTFYDAIYQNIFETYNYHHVINEYKERIQEITDELSDQDLLLLFENINLIKDLTRKDVAIKELLRETEFIVSYEKYAALKSKIKNELKKFQKVLPVNDIASINMFDYKIYRESFHKVQPNFPRSEQE